MDVAAATAAAAATAIHLMNYYSVFIILEFDIGFLHGRMDYHRNRVNSIISYWLNNYGMILGAAQWQRPDPMA